MSNLRNAISQLANQFATGVLDAIRAASLEDILLETKGGGGAKRGPAPRAHVTAPLAKAAAPAVAKPAAPAVAKKRGRLERRSAGDIAQVVGRIVALLGQNSKGLRAEQIRAKLGLDAKELPRPIAQALDEKKISKVGEKRATTYFAGAGKPVAAAKGASKAKPAKAAKPAAKPVKAVAKAVKPAAKPVKAVVKPVKAVAKAAKPAAKPVKAVAKAVKPAAKPVKAVAKAAKPAAKPVKPAAKPVKAVAKAAKPAKAANPPKASKPVILVAEEPSTPIEEAVTIATNGVATDLPS